MSDLEAVLAHRAQLLAPVTAAERIVADLVAAQSKLDQQIDTAAAKAAAAMEIAENLGRQRVELAVRIDAAKDALADVRKPLDRFDAELDVVRARLN